MANHAPRIPVVTSFGREAPQLPKAIDWKKIEGASYKNAFCTELRARVEAETKKFLQLAHLEAHAKPKGPAKPWIKRIGKAAWTLECAVTQLEAGDDDLLYTCGLICSHMTSPSVADAWDEFLALRDKTRQIFEACRLARQELDSNEGIVRKLGDEWNAWIRRLAVLLCEHDHMPTARHDSDKQADPESKQSAFVSFVWELQQQCVPREHRHSKQRKSALAKAISRARKGIGTETPQVPLVKSRKRRGAVGTKAPRRNSRSRTDAQKRRR